jgi:RNA polymerase sigma factor (sigma-70 family)
VARRWPRIRRMERPLAYARRILVNRALSGSARRTRRRQELTVAAPSEPATVADGVAEIGVADELMDALAALPPRQRAVLVLRYFLDLPEAEVAATLKCSLGTVKSTASRGLARLEQAMRPTHDPRSIPT